MPVLSSGRFDIDYSDDGAGAPVILLHSSACGNKQWRWLIQDLQDGYRVIALNLLGYGRTTHWPEDRAQTLDDQAELVAGLAETIGKPIHLVGHSFGAAVAMKAALNLSRRAFRRLLERRGRLGGHVAGTAVRFPRNAVPQLPRMGRRHERDHTRRRLARPSGADLGGACRRHQAPDHGDRGNPGAELPGITEIERPEGGHMAPLARPDLVNTVVRRFLDATS